MVKFPASVTGEIVVLTGEDLPHARRMRRATALGFLGQDACWEDIHICVCAFKRFWAGYNQLIEFLS